MATVRIDRDKITDVASFHLVFKEAFDFPAFYGKNMNVWIDWMSSLLDDDGLNGVLLKENETLQIEITKTEDFIKRLP